MAVLVITGEVSVGVETSKYKVVRVKLAFIQIFLQRESNNARFSEGDIKARLVHCY